MRRAVSDVLKKSPEWTFLNSHILLEEEAVQKITSLAQLLHEGVPWARIFSHRLFRGCEFLVTEHTLDPRPETEVLVEYALDHIGSFERVRVLDVGAGTGCIGISVLLSDPKAYVTALDICDKALSVAQTNAAQHKVEGRFEVVCADLHEYKPEGFYDVVLSNPPYIPSQNMPDLPRNVLEYDPWLALDGGASGVECYAGIFMNLKQWMRPGGVCVIEFGMGQEAAIRDLARLHQVSIQGFFEDHLNVLRFAHVTL